MIWAMGKWNIIIRIIIISVIIIAIIIIIIIIYTMYHLHPHQLRFLLHTNSPFMMFL